MHSMELCMHPPDNTDFLTPKHNSSTSSLSQDAPLTKVRQISINAYRRYCRNNIPDGHTHACAHGGMDKMKLKTLCLQHHLMVAKAQKNYAAVSFLLRISQCA